MSAPRTWHEIHEHLTSRRRALNAQIAAYPGPITGCDAQFNHLLEERAGLNAELARLSQLNAETGPDRLTQFVEECPYLDSAGGEQNT